MSEDPEDSVFYSSCFVREKNITWLPPYKPIPKKKPAWGFPVNGFCLACESYNESVAGRAKNSLGGYQNFSISSQCTDCAAPLKWQVLTRAAKRPTTAPTASPTLAAGTTAAPTQPPTTRSPTKVGETWAPTVSRAAAAAARQSPSSPVRFLPVSQYLLELASGVWVLECGVLTSREA